MKHVLIVLALFCSVAAAQTLVWNGAWTSTTAYVAGDTVTYLGGTYVATASSTNVPPPTNGADWTILAQPGATVSVGNTITAAPLTNAAVTNSGTSKNAVLNFTIPQGYISGGGGGIPYPAYAGVAVSSGQNSWVVPSYSNITSLWAGGSCNGYLNSNGTCSVTTLGAAGGDLSGNYPSPTVATINGQAAATVAQGATGVNVNLVPDSNLDFGFTDWANPDSAWSVQPGVGLNGANAFIVTSADSGTYQAAISQTFNLIAGQTYTLSGYINDSTVTAGNTVWALYNTTTTTLYAQIGPSAPGQSGRYSTTFTMPGTAGTAVPVKLLCDTNAATFTGNVISSSPMVQGGSVMTAYVAGTSANAPLNNPIFTGNVTAPGIIPGILYSAAGTALPTCAAGIQGETATVKDATSPTYMGAYTSGGAVTAAVICSYNGTTYSWETH